MLKLAKEKQEPKNEVEDLVESFRLAKKDLMFFQTENFDTLKKYNDLRERMDTLEGALRATVKARKESFKNSFINVQYIVRNKVSYDPDTFLNVFPEGAEIPGLLHYELDKDIFEIAVASGKISSEVALACKKSKVLSEAVKIEIDESKLGYHA